MATVPSWDYGVGRPNLSNFDRSAQLLTDRGIANDKFRADVAKMGGIDNYRKALVDFEKDYINYQIDFAKENGYLNDLSNAYQKAIDSGFFSSSEVKNFQKSYDKLQPQIAEAARQKETDRVAKEQRRGRLEAAASISGPLLNQAAAESNALITKAQGERDAAKQQIESQYQEDYKTINDLYNSGQIIEQQRDVAIDQAEANWSSAMQTVDANFTAAKNSINSLYEQNESYIKSLDADLRSGEASPTGKYAINSTPAELKPITANYSVASAAIPAVEDLPELQPEVDPYAGMTIQERMAAKGSEAQARIDEAMSRPQPTVETRSIDDIFADALSVKQANETEARESYFEGPGGLTLDQSEEIAKVLTAFTGVGEITDLEGKPYDNPIEQITNRIYSEGYQSVLDDMLEQGGVLPVSGNYIDRAVAEDFAKQMLEGNNFNLTNLDSWANSVQRLGFEGAAQSFKDANGRETVFLNPIPSFSEDGLDETVPVADAIKPFIDRNNTAIQTLRDAATERIDDSILRVMAGLPALPTIPEGMTTQEVLDQIYSSSNFNLSPELQENLVGYADKFGADTALAYLDLLVNPTNAPGRDVSVYDTVDELFSGDRGEPVLIDRGEPTLGTTGPTLPSTTDLGVPVERGEVTPAAGLGAITNAYPTTLPTTGVPTSGVPAGFQTSTYQPAPYTPPPLLAQAPTRPTLTPMQELIGAPGIDRGVPVPMQALTPEQVGSRFVPPTQEDYYAFFGYTPEQLNAAQYLAELEGAPRAGIAAQTVPTLPPAVTGAPAPTGMKEGGMPQDAQRLAAQGRGGDSTLVHMAPEEVAGLQALARQNGTSLTINPETGLPEALSLKKLLPVAVTLGAYALGVPIGTAALAYGAGTAIGSGSLEQGIAAGLTAYGGANLAAGGLEMAGVGIGPSASGAAAGAAEMGSISLTPSPGDLDYFSSANRNILSDATNYAMKIPSTVPTTAGGLVDKGALPFLIGSSSEDAIVQARDLKEQEKANNAIYAANLEDERKRNRQLFESTLGSVPLQYARKGGLMQLAGGGMTYAEGGGTTGATNEPRMVKGTGDGMSDSVPATIEGVQEARLANDEFVIPADVVADLGNGSSSAGAQQLYDMMDRVRQARHGTTEQPPEIDVRKLMPA